MNPIGPLVAADEQFCHQITDTFGVVGSSDLAWTEKVCAMAVARDGSLQLGFGLGKYPNRDVMDAYAGISRGVEQVTVRASRRLSPAFEDTTIGPIHYEVLEPLRSVRFRLAPNGEQPISFDWTFTAALPCALEERTHQRNVVGTRVSAELVRYHQIGTASGWVEIDGQRTAIDDGTWVSTRDHSWGVRYEVGRPLDDVERVDPLDGLSFSMIWSPILCERTDGSRYGIFLHTVQVDGFGSNLHKVVTGAIEHEDGTAEPILDIDLSGLSFDPANRRLLGGEIHLRMADGSDRPLRVDVPTPTGFHLGAGLYFGYRGHYHGEFRGPLHLESERIADCSAPERARELHQIRDTFVVVDDPVGGGTGYGNCQPIVTGPSERFGLAAEDSFW
ncbi:MAG: hypothetical protein ACKOZL_04360 [Actinomycetes bacterium]